MSLLHSLRKHAQSSYTFLPVSTLRNSLLLDMRQSAFPRCVSCSSASRQ